MSTIQIKKQNEADVSNEEEKQTFNEVKVNKLNYLHPYINLISMTG